MQRALQNLIQNSVKHSGGDGSAGAGEKELGELPVWGAENGSGRQVEIRIRLRRERRRLLIRVEDVGAGYSEAVLCSLKNGRKKNAEPTIRGLGIVKKIVSAHGGAIQFGNSPEGGSFCEMRFRG